ncbi:MAG: Gfo/Idh/MocA family oxidoreductase [Planctomycetota bacterium]|nr:Gfo/Idh/MocA family oxidoreductase [Planctomycetota bacterium]
MNEVQPLRWGLLGTGMIADKLASQVPQANRADLQAVGSRSAEKARQFGQRHGCRPYGSYEAVLSDPDVDAVYVALPNGLHHGWTNRALEAGKHVLCEKPLATNVVEAQDMFATARRCDRVLTEAFMYRCSPRVKKTIELAQNGAVGPLKLIRSNFCFQRSASRDDARYHAGAGGGALMDVGCYPINFCRALTGAEPSSAQAVGHIHEFGVDDYAVGMLRFAQDVLATFSCGMTVATDWSTVIAGSQGYLAIDNAWLGDGPIIQVRDGQREEITIPATAGPYALELDHFAAVVQEGAPAAVSTEDSLGNMRVLDQLRRQIGVPV